VLTESDMNSSAVTTFTVFPGGGSLGRISAAWDGAGGIGGLFEQLFAPTVLRAIYAGELKRLDTCARPPFPVSPPHTVGGMSGCRLSGAEPVGDSKVTTAMGLGKAAVDRAVEEHDRRVEARTESGTSEYLR
jgi:hypothetical protein